MLSYGGGQDSTAILYLLGYDPAFRRDYASSDLLVLMSDTGKEWPETYAHIREVAGWCERKKIDYVFLTNELGFHSTAWPTLQGFYERTQTCGSKAFPKTCTDNLKIQPFYRYLSSWVANRYKLSPYGHPWKGKTPLVNFAAMHGRINVLLGIARGEEKRIGSDAGLPVWMRRAIRRRYPLLDRGMDRQDCQDYIAKCGRPVPVPSYCMFCPFMSEIDLVWLARCHPTEFDEWARLERQKLVANAHKGSRNLAVWGGQDPLQTVLARALEKYGHWSDEQLREHRMSHGHCVRSKY